MKARTITFWAATGLFCLIMYAAGVMNLIRYPGQVESITELGYPVYLMTILGVAKVAGATALLTPKAPSKLKEWAYAGFTFDLLGASASHAFVGHGIAQIAAPLAILLIAFVSYRLRPNEIKLNGLE